jgi:hypothetical protein
MYVMYVCMHILHAQCTSQRSASWTDSRHDAWVRGHYHVCMYIVCICKCMYVYNIGCMHTYIHTYIHTYEQWEHKRFSSVHRKYICMSPYIHTYIHTYIRAVRTQTILAVHRKYICMSPYIHTYIHACMHTYSASTTELRNGPCLFIAVERDNAIARLQVCACMCMYVYSTCLWICVCTYMYRYIQR